MVMTSSRDFDSDMKISSSRDFDPVHRCPGASLRLNAYPHFCGDVNQRGPALLIRQRQRRPPPRRAALARQKSPIYRPILLRGTACEGQPARRSLLQPASTAEDGGAPASMRWKSHFHDALDVQRTLSAPPAAPSPPHPVAACSPLRETVRRSCMTAR